MNKVILIGNLVRDPELAFAKGTGNAVSKFTIAVKRQFKKEGQAEADFINCVSFGKTAETIASYLTKGKPILVEGHITTGSYDHKDGYKVYTTDIMVERFEFIGTKEGSEDKKSKTKGKKKEENEDFTPVDDDCIPF